MDDLSPSIPLGYAEPIGAAQRFVRAWPPPLVSLVPQLAFLGLLFACMKFGATWMGIDQRSERLLGSLWIGAAVLSFTSFVTLAPRRKRWAHWLCIAFHGLFVLATVLPPGCIGVAFLMHWLTGPGA